MIVILISLLQICIRADLPIECLKNSGQIKYIGRIWTFHVDAQINNINLYESNEICKIWSIDSYGRE